MSEWVDESELARRFSVDREVLRDARLEMPADLTRLKKRVVQWSDEAVSLWVEKNGLPQPAPFEARSGVELLTVCSVPGPSGMHYGPHHIKARRASGEVVVVRVLDSTKWRTVTNTREPMTFPAKKSGGHWWLPLKQPRWTGVW